VEFDWGKEVMMRTLILKLVDRLLGRKVGQTKSEQKIIVAGEINIYISNK
jgi:hypothetical protein